MKEAERIGDQIKRAFEGDAWHGPALGELLSDVTAGQASARPASGAHGIWELVAHITAWEEAALRALDGESIDLSPQEDWPDVTDESETAWKQAVHNLERVHKRLGEAVSRLDDRRLDDTVAGKEYSFYMLLHGVCQHSLYHAGQIAILKKD